MDENQPIVELDTDLLQPNPLQPRGVITPESLTELVNSIREQGILEPLVVAKTPAGYQIIAGERRWRAAKLLGLKKVPVVVKETTPRGMLEMSIVENVQREDLNPIERAQAYKRLIDEFGMSVTEIANRVGKSLPTISNTLRLLTLPDAIKDALAAGVITEGHVRPLITIEDQKLMIEAFRKILIEGISVRGAEQVARQIKSELEKRGITKSSDLILIKEQDEMANNLKEKYKCREVRITQTSKKAEIKFVFVGDPQNTSKAIQEIYNKLIS